MRRPPAGRERQRTPCSVPCKCRPHRPHPVAPPRSPHPCAAPVSTAARPRPHPAARPPTPPLPLRTTSQTCCGSGCTGRRAGRACRCEHSCTTARGGGADAAPAAGDRVSPGQSTGKAPSANGSAPRRAAPCAAARPRSAEPLQHVSSVPIPTHVGEIQRLLVGEGGEGGEGWGVGWWCKDVVKKCCHTGEAWMHRDSCVCLRACVHMRTHACARLRAPAPAGRPARRLNHPRAVPP